MAKIQEQIANARKANIPDQEIFSAIVKSPRYAAGFERARAAGLSNADIAKDLGLTINVNVKMPSIRLTAEGTPYKPFDNTKEARQKREQEALKKQGPAQLWESGLLGLADIGVPFVQAAQYAKDKISQGVNAVAGTNLPTNSYEGVTKTYKDINNNHNTVRKANKQGIDVTRMGANMLLTAPIAGVGGTLKSGVPLVSKAGAEFLGKNAALGALVGATGVHENNTERLKSMRNGAIGGAVGGAVGKKLGDGVAKVVNIKNNRMKEGVQEVAELAKKHNVKTTAGDLSRNPIIQKTEVAMEQVPFAGTSGVRKAQHDQVKVAADKVIDQLKTKLDDVDFKSINKIQAAASAGDKNAIRIMGVVNGAGDDTGKILQAAAEVKNWRGQRVASQMYEQVGRLAGSGTVAPNKTVQAIDNVIAADSKVTPNKELLGEINSIRKNLLDPNINTNFKEMRAAQSRLGELVDEWGRQGKSTSGLTQIRTAIDDDILDFAQSSGNTKLLSELKRANALYGQLQGGKDKAFASSLRSDKPDEIFNQFMKVGKGDKAANFYKNLDPKGQAALRYQMAQNALDKAWNPNKEVFSPARFAQEFESMSAPYSNVFRGADKAQMDGFVKLMRHVERAGQYMENPPTGNRAIGVLMGGAAVVNPAIALKIGGFSATAKALFTTEAGKRILLAARDVPPNSPQMANLLMQAQKLATTGGASTSKD